MSLLKNSKIRMALLSFDSEDRHYFLRICGVDFDDAGMYGASVGGAETSAFIHVLDENEFRGKEEVYAGGGRGGGGG